MSILAVSLSKEHLREPRKYVVKNNIYRAERTPTLSAALWQRVPYVCGSGGCHGDTAATGLTSSHLEVKAPP